MSTMGKKIDQFNVPVCNSFKAKIINDQLCYEVDVQQFINKDNMEQSLKLGLVFLMDYNEDRQTLFDKTLDHIVDSNNLVGNMEEYNGDDEVSIISRTHRHLFLQQTSLPWIILT